MIFGEVRIEEAAGGLLAHRLEGGGFVFRKGHILAPKDAALLAAAGRTHVVVARLEPGDVGEDEAARVIAAALAGSDVVAAPAATGRANLHAAAHGLAVIDAERVHLANAVSEAVTVATVPEFALLQPRQMLATVKIIPFCAPAAAVEACRDILMQPSPAIRVARLRPHAAGLVQTRLPGTRPGLLAKTVAVTRARLTALGSTLAAAEIVAHEVAVVRTAILAQHRQGLNPILVAGASAIVDRRDVVPTAIAAAGGELLHFGMPVDPGNLLLLARLSGAAVVGMPGCARSPKRNGFDWVLQRLLAGVEVGPAEIMRCGVGGLLAEIPSRPHPRQRGALAETAPDMTSRAPATAPDKTAAAAPRVPAIVLAAGLGTRMGGADKLLVAIDGRPLVATAVAAACASRADPVIVVVGHRAERVRAALAAMNVRIVENARYRDGLGTSLGAGLTALPDGIDGVVILLGDMPRVGAGHVDRLIAAFAESSRAAICLPVYGGRRGNPVLWPKRFFAALAAVAGDTGGRALIARHGEAVREVEMPDDAVLVDVDEPGDLAGLTPAPAAGR